MAEFNPSVPESGAPNFLGYSRGVDAPRPNRTFEALFEGVGNVIGATAKALDKKNIEDIKSDLYSQIDPVREEFSQGERGPQSPLPSDAPPALRQSKTQMERLSKAYKDGRLRDSHYWAKLEAITKQVRSRYPGYRDEIDSIVSSITGSTPANALRRSLRSEALSYAEETSSQGKRYENYLNQNEEYLPPDFYERQSSGKPYDEGFVHKYVSDKKREDAEIRSTRDRLALAKDQKTLNETDAYSSAIGEVNTYLNNVVNDTSLASGQDGSSIMDMAKKAGEDGHISPEEDQQLRSSFGKLRFTVESEIRERLAQPWKDGGTDSYATVLPADKVEEIVKQGLARVDTIQGYLLNGDFGLLSANTNATKAMKDADTRRLLESSGMFRKLQAVGSLPGGGDLMTSILAQTENGFLNDTAKAIRDLNLAENISGESEGLTKQTERMQEAGVTDPRAYKTLIDDSVNLLTSKDADPRVQAEAAGIIFGEGSNGFLAKFEPDERMTIFGKLASPEVTKRMIELGKTDPSVWKNYKDWVLDKFSGLFKDEAADVQDGIQFRENILVTFDPSANQFVVAPSKRAGQGGLVGGAERLLANRVKSSIDEFNKAVKVIEPILKADGVQDIPGELLNWFAAMGVNPDSGKSPTMFRILQGAVQGALGAMGENLSGGDKGIIQGAKEGIQRQTDLSAGKEDRGVVGSGVLAQYAPDEVGFGVPDERADQEGFDLIDLSSPIPMGGGDQFSPVLDMIGSAEAPQGYNQIYGNGREAPLTDMTLDEVLGFQGRMRRAGSKSTAVGRYQFIQSTLRGLKERLGLTGDEDFTPELQDRLAVALLQRRGLSKFLSGKMTKEEFANSLTKEWAGLPLANGSSFYEGDGLNHSTVGRDDLLSALEGILAS